MPNMDTQDFMFDNSFHAHQRIFYDGEMENEGKNHFIYSYMFYNVHIPISHNITEINNFFCWLHTNSRKGNFLLNLKAKTKYINIPIYIK